MVPTDTKRELCKLFQILTEELDITETQFNNLVRSYGAVGEYLEKDPIFAPYHPVVSPQGSLRLGTIIQPINPDDDLDVDLVYRLLGKSPNWTQKDIKDLVGFRLQNHGIYSSMLDKEEGRRCWTLLYREKSDNPKERYHMDILPSVADVNYDKSYSNFISANYSYDGVQRIAIRITDKKDFRFCMSTDISEWLKSNPDGYAIWFANRCKQGAGMILVRDIIPIGHYNAKKTVLQQVVQILKRHRDYMFRYDRDNKPISIIITTLAAMAYQGETNILDALIRVVNDMELYIKKDVQGNYVISNPVNSEENFADKWPSHPRRKENFFRWLNQLKKDLDLIMNSKGISLQESMKKTLGDVVVQKVFNRITEDFKNAANNNTLKIASTGIIGSIGKSLNAKNTFFGKEE